MSATNTMETGLLKLIFQNIALANIGNAGGLQPSTVAGNWYAGLLTVVTDGEVGTVTEANYTGYARQPIPRSAVGFTVTGNTVSNAAAVTFPICTAGTNTVTYFGYWTDLTGGDFEYYGLLENNGLSVTQNVVPNFAIGQLSIVYD